LRYTGTCCVIDIATDFHTQISSGLPDLHSGVDGGAIVEPMMDMCVDPRLSVGFDLTCSTLQGDAAVKFDGQQATRENTWFLCVTQLCSIVELARSSVV
jgi:hypothetical protein